MKFTECGKRERTGIDERLTTPPIQHVDDNVEDSKKEKCEASHGQNEGHGPGDTGGLVQAHICGDTHE